MCHRHVVWACPFSAPGSARWLCHSALGWLFRSMKAALHITTHVSKPQRHRLHKGKAQGAGPTCRRVFCRGIFRLHSLRLNIRILLESLRLHAPSVREVIAKL